MKQTEIGLIPDDWSLEILSKIASFRRGTFPQPYGLPKWYGGPGNYPFVQVADLSDDKFELNENTNQTISKLAQERSLFVPKGSVIVTLQGTIGRVAITQYDCFMDRTLAVFEYFKKKISKEYFALALHEKFQIEAKLAPGGIIKTITKEVFSNFQILLPSSVKEQQRIAKALSDVDALISTTEKLIQKKKNIKQGTMQNLLTGKKRLPGFGPQTKSPAYKQTELGFIPEDWEVIKIFGNYFLKGRIGWQGLKASEFTDKGPYLVTGTDFYNGRVNWESCYHISEERYEEDKALHVKLNDILITKDGTVGKVAYIDKMPKKVTLNSHLLIIRPLKEKLINRYLFYILNSNFFFDYYQQTQTGTTMASLSQDKISKFVYPLPSKEEQTAIANVLSSMDKEIETLNTKLEKYRNLKTAMMQQLVTGKIRLIK